MKFAAWVKTQTNLREILKAWELYTKHYKIAKRQHAILNEILTSWALYTTIARRTLLASRVFGLVTKWQQGAIGSRPILLKSILHKVFDTWWLEVPTSDQPDLVSSSGSGAELAEDSSSDGSSSDDSLSGSNWLNFTRFVLN